MAKTNSAWVLHGSRWVRNIPERNSKPWADGNYKLDTMNNMIFVINGENVVTASIHGGVMDEAMSKGTFKFGEFEEAHPDVAKFTGKKNYNVDMSMWNGMWLTKGIVSDDGKKITFWSMTNELSSFEWLSEEDYAALKDCGDPADAPTNHYKIQPENVGRLLWISGAPGLGKSTSGLVLSRTADYVYYEADAFGTHVNPYIPPDVEEPSLATVKQKPLKGLPQERIDAVNKGVKDFMKLVEGKEYEVDNVNVFYTAMCKDIAKERKRMGGDWVVAQAVPKRVFRDNIREQLGPELIFVVLHMSKEDQKKRIVQRHGDQAGGINDWLIKLYDLYEPATEDEPNAINVVVTSDMSRDDVVQKILKMLPE